MSAKNGAIKLVAGNSNPALALAIANSLQLPLTKAVVRRFADMEIFVEIQENVRGADVFILQSTSEGSPGIEYVRWKKPVLAGDTLTGRATITTKRRSKSRPDIGFANCRGELKNQRGESVLELENTGMFRLRNPEATA